MAISLKALSAKLSAGEVLVRGEMVRVRAITEVEESAVEELWPRPAPPLGPDPTKGSLAPPIERPDDPGFRRGLAAWRAQTDPVLVAIATDLEVDGRTFDAGRNAKDRKSWCESAHAFILHTLRMTRAEMRGILNKEFDLTGPGLAEAVRGNSSGPSGPGGVEAAPSGPSGTDAPGS